MSKQERDQQHRPPAGQSPPVTRAPPSAGRHQSRLPEDTHAKEMNSRPSMRIDLEQRPHGGAQR